MTLAVIGVIADLTIPTMMASYQKSVYETSFRTAYSDFVQATKRYMLSKDNKLVNNMGDIDNVMSDYCEIYNCVEICASGDREDCGHPDFGYNISGKETYSMGGPPWRYIQLSNGMAMGFYLTGNNDNCEGSNFTKDTEDIGCLWVKIDTNALEGPNKLGYDQYKFGVHREGPFVEGTPGSFYDDISEYCTMSKNLDQDTNGRACGGRILLKGGIDYL